jgi:hypothetical protein
MLATDYFVYSSFKFSFDSDISCKDYIFFKLIHPVISPIIETASVLCTASLLISSATTANVCEFIGLLSSAMYRA